nr:hypothetical protein [Propionicimonas sp.]
MTTPRPRLVPAARDEALRSRDRAAALAAGLRPAEAELAERSALTGRRVADARAWHPWMMLLRAPRYLVAAALAVPLTMILVITVAARDAADAAMPLIFGFATLAAALWLANLVASWFVPDVLKAVDSATTLRSDGYWSRAMRAVIEVEQRLGPEAAATFDGTLADLHDDAVRLAEGDALWLKLNGPATSDPELVGLRHRVETRVQEITTAAVRMISPSPGQLEGRPVEWHPAGESPVIADRPQELLNETDLR